MIKVDMNEFGKCLIATANLKKGTTVASFDGLILKAQKASELPVGSKNHAIQFAENKWRDSYGIARYANHSCNPNCGIKDMFILITMRNVVYGEELTWDYDMTENSDWRMECRCGALNCRKTVGAFSLLPLLKIKEYEGYISPWLIKT